jgi:hypothetical protein
MRLNFYGLLKATYGIDEISPVHDNHMNVSRLEFSMTTSAHGQLWHLNNYCNVLNMRYLSI